TPDYTNIATAVTALNNWGVSCATIFNIRNGTYTESTTSNIINNITNSSATNTITFQSESGDSSQVIWTLTSNSSNGVVRLNATNYITFQKLTIKEPVGTYSAGINVTTAGSNINILNNVFTGVGTSDNLVTLLASSTVNIKNNVFTSGSACISASGAGGSGLVID